MAGGVVGSCDADAGSDADRLRCGVSYDVLYAEINYELGLANISHDDFAKAHNGTFNLNIGVNF